MNILTIVVFVNSPTRVFSASLKAGLLFTDPHEIIIKNSLLDFSEFVKEFEDGIYSRIGEKVSYYAYSDHEKKIVVAIETNLDESGKLIGLDRHARIALFEKLLAAQNKEALMELIKNPDAAMKTKYDGLNVELDDVLEMLKIDMDKMLVRGEDIEQLKMKSENLVKLTEGFKRAGTNLKNRTRCPTLSSILGLFGFFGTVKSWIWGETEEFDYIPTKKRGYQDHTNNKQSAYK